MYIYINKNSNSKLNYKKFIYILKSYINVRLHGYIDTLKLVATASMPWKRAALLCCHFKRAINKEILHI